MYCATVLAAVSAVGWTPPGRASYTVRVDDDSDLVAGAFAQQFGHKPTGVWSAPGRVNLIGEHTDYNNGLCLPIAMPQRAWLAASARDDDIIRLHSVELGEATAVALDDVAPGRPGGWAAYQAGVLWAMRQAGLPVRGVDAVLRSDVPIGSGLSSSAAIEGCLAVAASALFGLNLADNDLGLAKLAALCQRAENDIAGAPTGGLDQTASLRAQAGKALLIDFDDLDDAGLPSAAQVPFDLTADGLALLVMNTHAPHANVDGQYGARRRACHAAAEALGVPNLRAVSPDDLADALARLSDPELARAVRHVVTETERVRLAVAAAEARDWARVGELFDASHASLRDDYRVSCDQLDVACAVARNCGALGARMTGGGFGGSAIALIEKDVADAVAPRLEAEYAARGWAAPEVFAIAASAGAR